MPNKPIPIQQIPALACRQLRGIFCDIDDTLTTAGKLPASAYTALWRARESGLRVVPVTGRPAGWVDHIARMWPVDAVVGENGAFYFWLEDGKMRHFFVQDRQTRQKYREKLEAICQQVLAEVPGAAISADQDYRISDLAIDFCEDVPPLDRESIERIVAIFHAAGAQAKVSSIHVNGWFGEFDKFSTCRLAMEQLWQESFPDCLEYYLYCGDSPNDEPMFAQFPHAVGVANVGEWLDDMQHPPRYITSNEGGDGFAELVEVVLKNRNSSS